MAKRVLLIGASKHIGFHVLEELASQPEKYTLFVLARSAAATIAPFNGKENVTFIQGDAKDETIVSNAINSTMNGDVDFIVVTVGGTIVFNKFFMPKFSDVTLCGTVAKTLLTVLATVQNPPTIIAVSSTGILSTKNLLPLPLKPLYRTMMYKPHADKIDMENAISEGYASGKWILIRGALLTDGKKTGKYRSGEREFGYTISRKDVADFIVRECIDGDGKWFGKRPVLVY